MLSNGEMLGFITTRKFESPQTHLLYLKLEIFSDPKRTFGWLWIDRPDPMFFSFPHVYASVSDSKIYLHLSSEILTLDHEFETLAVTLRMLGNDLRLGRLQVFRSVVLKGYEKTIFGSISFECCSIV